MPILIHIVQHGNSLCGMQGPTSDWPEWHRWVSFEDPLARDPMNCPHCLLLFAEQDRIAQAEQAASVARVVQAARALMFKIGPRNAATELDLRHLAQAVFGTRAAFGEDEPAERDKQWGYAAEHGFFWALCPRCGRMFGGHEQPSGGCHWNIAGTTGQVCCPQCPGESGGVASSSATPVISVSLKGSSYRNR